MCVLLYASYAYVYTQGAHNIRAQPLVHTWVVSGAGPFRRTVEHRRRRRRGRSATTPHRSERCVRAVAYKLGGRNSHSISCAFNTHTHTYTYKYPRTGVRIRESTRFSIIMHRRRLTRGLCLLLCMSVRLCRVGASICQGAHRIGSSARTPVCLSLCRNAMSGGCDAHKMAGWVLETIQPTQKQPSDATHTNTPPHSATPHTPHSTHYQDHYKVNCFRVIIAAHAIRTFVGFECVRRAHTRV